MVNDSIFELSFGENALLSSHFLYHLSSTSAGLYVFDNSFIILPKNRLISLNKFTLINVV